jgi:D-glycero-D-manno-heptose 1,7-bisphosphate phosphatase
VSPRFDAVFVDRDGTLNVSAPEGAYITSPDDVVLIEGVGPAMRQLNEAGVSVYVVTNQRGVARGVMSSEEVGAVNAQLIGLLGAFGAVVDGIYVCPHEIDACDCRKPKPGLLLQCVADHPHLDLSHSVMIGDVESDIAAGLTAGTQTIRIDEGSTPTAAQYTVPDFAAAVEVVLSKGWPRSTMRAADRTRNIPSTAQGSRPYK